MAPELGRTGCHRQHGIFIAAGPDVERGLALDADIMDLAPTILHLFGLPVSTNTDGRVLHEVFAPGSSASAAVRYTDDAGKAGEMGSGLTTEEEELVMERLKELGYV